MYAFIGDLHLGVNIPQIDYLKSLDNFFGLIKNHKEECHCIFVCGDVFDHKLTIEESKFAALFLINLVCNYCGRSTQHVPVRFIHGTYNHDNDQYDIYLNILKKIPNVDVMYYKVATITTFHGLNVLYLPQEYGNIDYSLAFKNKYDIIIGHGPITSEKFQPCKSTQYEINHSVELLGSISKITVFGHFHGYTDFGNNVYYTGPWLRWKYGEDTDRVFFFCNDNYEVETYPNDIALIFETVDIYDIETLRNYLSNDITNPHRFIIHCKNDDLPEYHGLMNTYKKNKFIKYQIMSEKEETVNDTRNSSNVSSTIVEPIPALLAYINDKYNIDVTTEIKDYETKINRDEK